MLALLLADINAVVETLGLFLSALQKNWILFDEE
jgi:hypothetical protein